MFDNPTIADFKAQFVRDFPYSPNATLGVMDADIGAAFNLVNVNMNQDLFPNQGSYTIGYNYLAAHYLCMNLRASSQGINGQYNWIQNNKSVQAVSEGFMIPDQFQGNAFLAMLVKTNYGAMFFQLIEQQLIGVMFTAWGPARAL